MRPLSVIALGVEDRRLGELDEHPRLLRRPQVHGERPAGRDQPVRDGGVVDAHADQHRLHRQLRDPARRHPVPLLARPRPDDRQGVRDLPRDAVEQFSSGAAMEPSLWVLSSPAMPDAAPERVVIPPGPVYLGKLALALAAGFAVVTVFSGGFDVGLVVVWVLLFAFMWWFLRLKVSADGVAMGINKAPWSKMQLGKTDRGTDVLVSMNPESWRERLAVVLSNYENDWLTRRVRRSDPALAKKKKKKKTPDLAGSPLSGRRRLGGRTARRTARRGRRARRAGRPRRPAPRRARRSGRPSAPSRSGATRAR